MNIVSNYIASYECTTQQSTLNTELSWYISKQRQLYLEKPSKQSINKNIKYKLMNILVPPIENALLYPSRIKNQLKRPKQKPAKYKMHL